MRSSVLLVGHGSKVPGFDKPLKQLRSALSRNRLFFEVSIAYLDINAPSVPAALDRLVRRGAREIRVWPYFLLAGLHVKTHIPSLVKEAQKKYGRRVRVKLCPYVGYHPALLEIARDRLRCR